jgi:pimeloyl-ACP methyl ester carboxylesterase
MKESVRHDPITGRYVYVPFKDEVYRIYYEENGHGVPLVCLHTAGSDSRQFRHQLSNPSITESFRVIAFDLPWHGRSNPPDKWWLMEEEYRLDTDFYCGMIMAFCEAVGASNPVVMGSSMGGNICIPLAHRYPDKIRALIALEAAIHSPGWISDVLAHPAVHGGEIAASYTAGEIAPQSPAIGRWDIWWIYASNGPGVFKGDVYFYSVDHDSRAYAAQMVNTPPIYFMTGEYDGACSPEMSKRAADTVHNSAYVQMKAIGHFPMCENAPLFSRYLDPVLTHILNGDKVARGFEWPEVQFEGVAA